jgi:CBS domain-containing protein
MLHYQAIEIYTSEDARHQGKPVAEAVLHFIREQRIAARCLVTRGIAGCTENGELATGRLEVLSYNLPLRITIILPAAATEGVLAGLDERVTDGIIALRDLDVVRHKTSRTLFPRQLLVRDVMTPDPRRVTADSPLDQAARLLLGSIFTGLPVVDREGRPVGVVTQGDLLGAGLPLRLGLLAASEEAGVEAVLQTLVRRQVAEVMTSPAVTIGADRPLTEAVELMLERQHKRLPVVDRQGQLVGMLSRLDLFTTVMREGPDWNLFCAQQVEVGNLRTVADILRRDTRTVGPETGVDEVLRLIGTSDLQRVAVVDDEGLLLGLISDSDLLRAFKPGPEGLRRLAARLARPFGEDQDQDLVHARADEVMDAHPVTIREDALIEEAIRLMTEGRLKRLPVVDADGRFRGLISRDSLLRSGYGREGGRGQA